MSTLAHLIKQSRLRFLSLNYCKIGEVGGESIGEAIQFSSNIQEIRAKSNNFRDKTAKAFA